MSNFKVDNLECNTINGVATSLLGGSSNGGSFVVTEFTADNSGTIEGSEFGNPNITFSATTADGEIYHTANIQILVVAGFLGDANHQGIVNHVYKSLDNPEGTWDANLNQYGNTQYWEDLGVIADNSQDIEITEWYYNNKAEGELVSLNNPITEFSGTLTYIDPNNYAYLFDARINGDDSNNPYVIFASHGKMWSIKNATLYIDGVMMTSQSNEIVLTGSEQTFRIVFDSPISSFHLGARFEINNGAYETWDGTINNLSFNKKNSVTINQESTDTNFKKVELTTNNLDGDLIVNGETILSGTAMTGNIPAISTGLASNAFTTAPAGYNSGSDDNITNLLDGNKNTGSYHWNPNDNGSENPVSITLEYNTPYQINSVEIAQYQKAGFVFRIMGELNGNSIELLPTTTASSTIETSTFDPKVVDKVIFEFLVPSSGFSTFPIVNIEVSGNSDPIIPTESTTVTLDTDTIEVSVDGTVDSIDYQTYTGQDLDGLQLLLQAVAGEGETQTNAINKLKGVL